MAADIYPAYPPDLTPAQLRHLAVEAQDWAHLHGLVVRPPPDSSAKVESEADAEADADAGAGVRAGALATAAPVTLFPSLFPKECFEEALRLQPAYNRLYMDIVSEGAFLEEVLKDILDVDDFTAGLWAVHKAVEAEGYVQDVELGLFRSDYMVHADTNGPETQLGLRQVEFNTISSSFGGLAPLVSGLHRALHGSSTLSTLPPALRPLSLPSNDATDQLADGLAAAHHAYGAPRSTPSRPLCMLAVIQDRERNVFDQRRLELAASTHAACPIFRLPFSATLAHTSIPPDNPKRPLIYTPPSDPSRSLEVTVVYFRATYMPADFPDETAWKARTHLERSAAIKCPSILTQLAGCKKMQQVLATPDSPHLARFLPDPGETAAVRATFAVMYPMDTSPTGQQARKLATSPEESKGYVLKPQREGGGNNVYGAAIPGFLAGLKGEEQWAQYVLMERIVPPPQRNVVMRGGKLESGGIVAERGVFGTAVWRRVKREDEGVGGDGTLRNEAAGWLLRTKGSGSDEGGVAAGFGAIDSVALVDL